ncbi:MAG TPA: hypothetical protein VGR90_02080 [Acidimicrobiales bacterium]|nr:hypothetical protein [Acidimicrobiales bacterium]
MDASLLLAGHTRMTFRGLAEEPMVTGRSGMGQGVLRATASPI